MRHFQQAVIGGKDGLGLGLLAQLTVNALNGIGGVDQPAHLLGILETGTEMGPLGPLGPSDFRVFLTPKESRASGAACSSTAAWTAFRSAIGLGNRRKSIGESSTSSIRPVGISCRVWPRMSPPPCRIPALHLSRCLRCLEPSELRCGAVIQNSRLSASPIGPAIGHHWPAIR